MNIPCPTLFKWVIFFVKKHSRNSQKAANNLKKILKAFHNLDHEKSF